MATYRMFPSTNGPSTPASYSGNFICAVVFNCQNSTFMDGYWFWCCNSGQGTAPVKCALWSMTGGATGAASFVYTLVPGSVVTSATLVPGTWNYIPFPTPIQLAVGIPYAAAIGFTSVGGFPDTNNQFNSGGTYYNGILHAPLNCFGGVGSTNGIPNNMGQGWFSTSGSDPSITAPPYTEQGDNFWVDVQLDDSLPVGWTGSYRLWPTLTGVQADWLTQVDNAVDYVLATEVHITAASTVNNIWYYSMPGSAQLATSIDIWSISTGGITGTTVYHNASPSWSGAAGTGWVKAPVASLNLPVGSYKVSVYNGATTPDAWSAKRLNYWGGTGVVAPSGVTFGPLYAPNSSNGATSYSYGVPTAGQAGTTVTEPGQSTFSQSTLAPGPAGNVYPNQYVGTNSPGGNIYQNYWVDIEVTPLPSTANISGSISSVSTLGPSGLTTGSMFGAVLSASSLSGTLTVSGGGGGPPGSPTGVSAGPAGPTSISVSWLPPASTGGASITSYTVTPYIGTAPQTPVVVPASSTSTTVTGLAPATTYTFTVVATNSLGSSPPATSNPATTGYTTVITGLTGGDTYTFTVIATNTFGSSPESAPSNPVTLPGPSGPGTGFYIFTPPVMDYVPPVPAGEIEGGPPGARLMRYYPPSARGVNVFKMSDGTYPRDDVNGVWPTSPEVPNDAISSTWGVGSLSPIIVPIDPEVLFVYYGGHSYEVDQPEADRLTAAGYGPNLVPVGS
jgi:hypothetical protein